MTEHHSPPSHSDRGKRWAAVMHRTSSTKVPHVALTFWLVKLLTTGMGEAASDFIASLSSLIAVGLLAVTFAAFVLIFRAELRSQRYHPALYWGTVAMIAVFGTMAADVVHVVVGNTVTAILYAVSVVAVLWLWHRTEGSVSIHTITSLQRELFYWATVAATFALGTAAGDFAADTIGLGYRDAAVVFAVVMLVLVASWRFFSLPAVPVFWTAYALTRPLGASLADWFGKPDPKGLDLGDGTVAGLCLIVFAALVVWLVRSGHDAPGQNHDQQAV